MGRRQLYLRDYRCNNTSTGIIKSSLTEFGLKAASLFYTGLHYEGHNLGSLIIGTETEDLPGSASSVLYFIEQAKKMIPPLSKNKKEFPNYFSSSEIVKKTDADIVFVVDRTFTILHTTTTILSEKDLLKKNILSLVPDNIKNSFLNSMTTCFNTGEVEYEEIPLCIEGRKDVFYAIKFIPSGITELLTPCV